MLTWPSVLSRTQRLRRQLDLTIASKWASLDSVQIAEILGSLARLRTYLFSPEFYVMYSPVWAEQFVLTFHRRKPLSKVTCVNTEETIMEGHMHDHGLVYTSVPFVVFDEGG